jgi:ketosteroid isomerase-like protein
MPVREWSVLTVMITPELYRQPGGQERARASLRRRRAAADHEPPPTSSSPSEDAIVARFVSAYESAEVDALVALLTDDVFVSMPPMPFEYEGRDVTAQLFASIFGAGRRFELIRTRANGQPAFGPYLRTPTGRRDGTGLVVLTLTGDRTGAMSRFDDSVLRWFGLPQSLTDENREPAGSTRQHHV